MGVKHENVGKTRLKCNQRINMTYQEITNHLLRLGFNLGRPARIMEDKDHNVTGLHIEPVGWFLAIADTGELDLVRYRAEDLRLVEAKSIPFAQVTPKLIADKLDLALLEFVARWIAHPVHPRSGFLSGEPVEERTCRRIPLECQVAA